MAQHFPVGFSRVTLYSKLFYFCCQNIKFTVEFFTGTLFQIFNLRLIKHEDTIGLNLGCFGKVNSLNAWL